jgi:hypothetical protein
MGAFLAMKIGVGTATIASLEDEHGRRDTEVSGGSPFELALVPSQPFLQPECPARHK